MKKKASLHWSGTFIELCMGGVTHAQKEALEARWEEPNVDLLSAWYENTALLQSLFDAENWWSVNDVDHAMGFVFDDRSSLDEKIRSLVCEIDGSPASVDPEAFQLSFYAPEPVAGLLEKDDLVIRHGSLRQANLHLQAEIEPPFDPSLVTLSFLKYPDIGLILIDLDVDGHDDVTFTWGETTYLKPRFLGKDELNGTTG